jgi:hypothetical protein
MFLQQLKFTSSKIPLERLKVANSVFLDTRNFDVHIYNVHMFLPTENNENRGLLIRVRDTSEGSTEQESVGSTTTV